MSRAHRSGRWVRVTMRALFSLYGYRCARCGGWIDPTRSGLDPLGGTIGHVIALSHGGSDHLENLRPEHRRCNRAAGTSRSELEPAAAIVRYDG